MHMAKHVYVTKISGDRELFSEIKLRRSLKRVGASSRAIDQIVAAIKKELFDGISTKEIYKRAFEMLRREGAFFAARYNLKKAIFELGPTGFPFEKYVAELLKAEGYRVEINQFLQGRCGIVYEIDVVAKTKKKQFIVEAKYHSSQALKTDVKVVLYVEARFEDIMRASGSKKKAAKDRDKSLQPWLVTNTKFTSEAIKYGTCMGMRMIGWGYPYGQGLQAMIEKSGLHPITALTTISGQKKNILMKEGIVLCRDLLSQTNKLKRMGLNANKISRVLEEARTTCELPH